MSTPAAFPWPRLLLLAGATFATVTAELLPAGLLPAMSADLGVSPSVAGLLVSAWAVTVALVSLPLVRLTARVERRRVLAVSLAAFAAADLVTAAAPTFAVAAGSRVLGAAAHALFWSVVVAYAAGSVEDRHVGRAVSVLLAGPTLAGVVGLPLGAFVAETVGWRTAFAAVGLGVAIASVALATRLPRVAAAPVAGSLRHPSAARVLVLAVGGAVVLVGHFALFTYVAPLLVDAAGFTPSAVPPLLLVHGAAGVAGLALAAPLSERVPRAALPVTAVLFATALLSLVLLGRTAVGSVLLVVGWGVLVGLFPPVLQDRVLREAAPEFRDTAGALVITSLNVGIAAGAALGGAVLASGGAGALAPVAAGVAALAALWLVATASRRVSAQRGTSLVEH